MSKFEELQSLPTGKDQVRKNPSPGQSKTSPVAGDGFKPKHWGFFPDDTSTRKIHLDTLTKLEYGEKTWTTEQTIRDIFQNHLDANTQRYFEALITEVIDLNEPSFLQRLDQDVDLAHDLSDFGYALFYLVKAKPQLSEESRIATEKALISLSARLPLKAQCLNSQGKFNLDAWLERVEPVKEVLPEVKYKIKDVLTPQQGTRWVSLAELTSSAYLEQLPETDEFRYQIIGCQIADQGSGFDSKLTAFYKSSKAGSRHLRGKYGEGTKMSELHIFRHGAKLKMRSVFELEQAGNRRKRAWQARIFLGEEGRVNLKGVEVEMPTQLNQEQRTGSFSQIDAEFGDPTFLAEFQAAIDPRVRTGLAANIVEYSKQKFWYTIGVTTDGLKPVGVDLSSATNTIFVQGLRVPSYDLSPPPLFSYNLWDSSVIQGRDRNSLAHDLELHLKHFWLHADNPVLLNLLLSKVFGKGSPHRSLEKDVVDYMARGIFRLHSDQTQQTIPMFFSAVKDFFGFEVGKKYVLIGDSFDATNPERIAVKEQLSEQGYTLIDVPTTLPKNFTLSVQYHFENEFQVLTFEEARTKLEKDISPLPDDHEAIKYPKYFYFTAIDKLRQTLNAYQPALLARLNFAEPVFLKQPLKKVDNPIQVEWVDSLQRYRLVMYPEQMTFDLTEKRGIDYWQRYIIVYLLSTLGKTGPFENSLACLQVAQNVCQSILDSSVAKDQALLSRFPTGFEYHHGHDQFDNYIQRLFESTQKTEQEERASQIYIRARSTNLSRTEYNEYMAELQTLPPKLAIPIKNQLQRRFFSDGKTILRFDFYSRETTVQNLSELPTLFEWQGHEVKTLSWDYAVVSLDMPPGTLIKRGEEKILIGEKYFNYFSPDDFQIYTQDTIFDPLRIDRNCMLIKFGNAKDPAEQQAAVERILADLTIIKPESRRKAKLDNLHATIDTPLPVEYGQHEWDNPVRVFQDLAQNHLDEVADPSQVQEEYLVDRNGVRSWVKASGLSDTDKIVGYQLNDRGQGYAPNNLGVMGNSSKQSPLSSGKYGEGQKMIAAAAARYGFVLEYSSIAERSGQPFRWSATVGTRSENLFIKGQATTSERVVFQQTAQPIVTNETYTSSTKLSLPDHPTSEQVKVWEEWLEVIDPRQKNSFGEGGLSRYCLKLGQPDRDQIIDLGFIKILLNKPGALYENGIQIVPPKQLNQSGRYRLDSFFGYDVPEVVSSRERNAFSNSKLQKYLCYVMAECQDPKFVQALFSNLKTKYWSSEMTSSTRSLTVVDELEANLEYLLGSGWSMYPSSHLWKKIAEEEWGYSLVSSRQFFESKVRDYTQSLSQTNDQKTSSILTQKLRTMQYHLASLEHISPAHLVEVPQSSYQVWQDFLPSVSDLTDQLMEATIEVTPETQRKLREVVTESASIMSLRLNKFLYGTSDTDHTMTKILNSRDRGAVDIQLAKSVVKQRLAQWSSYAWLSTRPELITVAPSSVAYEGSASGPGVNLNEKYLANDDVAGAISVTQHEQLHKIFDMGDYTPEFIMLLWMLVPEKN